MRALCEHPLLAQFATAGDDGALNKVGCRVRGGGMDSAASRDAQRRAAQDEARS